MRFINNKLNFLLHAPTLPLRSHQILHRTRPLRPTTKNAPRNPLLNQKK
jgi:hypothetical protein